MADDDASMEWKPNIFRQPEQREKLPPCRAGCPSGTDVRGWLAIISQRESLGYSEEQALENAWRLIVDRNPFPATMGRICPHPCESNCNRAMKDGAVAVNAMERYIGDWAIERGLELPFLDRETKPESVGVIGAGPAGLSFSYQLARRGYSITVYDRADKPGGMLRYGIPDYRLPPAILDAEIRRIEKLGVGIVVSTRVGSDITLEDLRAVHDVLFLGIGASRGRPLGVPGEPGEGVYPGVDFLDGLARGQTPDLGSRVVVVGGGNTAIDAARSARRLGAQVTILYRRSRAEMPAIPIEIDEAIEEGVSIDFLAAPVRIIRDGDRITSVDVQRMRLSDTDESGRRRPVPVEGSHYRVDTDAVIVAVSQQPDWVGLEGIRPETAWLDTVEGRTLSSNLWAGGDVSGPGIASMAIAEGRRAAERVHQQLRQLPEAPAEGAAHVAPADLNLDYYAERDRVEPFVVDPDRRAADLHLEITSTISEDQFFTEADRCLSCGLCVGCGYCWMFCNADGFAKAIEPSPGNHFVLMLDRCEACGKCIEVCPCGFLSLKQPFTESA